MKLFTTILSLIISCSTFGQTTKPIIYFIPGQGADERLFSKLDIDTAFEIRHIQFTVPDKNTSLPQYAHQLATQIDTAQQFILIGVSLGGMLATEMNTFLSPLQTIIISSAKTKDELPFRYRFQKAIPVYKLFSNRAIKRGATIMQPLVEPDRNKEKELFKSMLANKNNYFMKRSVQMIIQWNRASYPDNIIHIHGDRDSTIPIKNVNYDYLVKDGSHMMTLTRPDEISKLINEVLKGAAY